MTKFGSPEEPIILVAGLEPESLKMLTSMFQTHGYDVRAATSGIRALAFLRSQRPAVVLLTGRLPDMDGFEICRWLRSREEGRNIPILLITSDAETELQEEGLKVGVSDFITTPLQEGEVLARIRTYVELSQFRAAWDWEAMESALRESEERFRVIADSVPIMIGISGPDKRLTFVNKGWLEFTGRTMEQELGTGWIENIHPDDRDRCLGAYSAAFEARQRFQVECRARRANGEYRWVLSNLVPRFSPDGAFAGYIGSSTDITDFKRSDFKHNPEKMLATQKLESLGVLASGIAHDFNNFLGCILADAEETISDLDPASPAREGLERIAAVASRASEIVSQMMAYGGQEQQNWEPVDIGQLVQELVQLLHVCMPKSGRLTFDFPADLPRLEVNAAQIRQVVMNLVLNASEALGEQNGLITIAARREHLDSLRGPAAWSSLPEGEYVCLEVSDTGVGMTEEVRTRIFDPFFTTKIAGRGLGLAAVQGIVRSHGGAIHVASTPGKGSTFRILLPCDNRIVQQLPLAKASLEPVPIQRTSILVVEDDDTLRLAVSRMLLKKGYAVLEASSGNLAIEQIRAQKQEIGVVLLDLNLPGTSSVEVFEELQRTRPGVKVILTSAYGRESITGSLKALRHESFLRKPYHLNELVAAVRNSLPPGKLA